MPRQKFIPIILIVLCGLALQFQTGAANAQQVGEINGINYTFVDSKEIFGISAGKALASPKGVKLVMQDDGNLVLSNQLNDVIWASTTSWQNCGDGQGTCFSLPCPPYFAPGDICLSTGTWFMLYQPGGDLVIYNWQTDQNVWSSHTTLANSLTGIGGRYLAVQDDGNLVIYDSQLDPIWAASWQSNYNWAAAAYAQGQCGC